MRRLLLLFPLLSLCSTACESDGRELFTQLSVRFILPDDRPVERIELLSDISYCENINTKERVFFTVLDGRSATLTLQKGVYTLIVEANLHYTTERCNTSATPTTTPRPKRSPGWTTGVRSYCC